MESRFRTRSTKHVHKVPSHDRMVSAFTVAWRLVQSHGLTRAAYNRIDYETMRDVLYLISQDVPIKRLVRILNGTGAKAQIRKKRRALVRAHAAGLGQADYVLTASHLAAVLAKLAPGALLAELHAGNAETAKHAYLSWLKQPRKAKLKLLSELPQQVAKEAWFDATRTANAIKERFGTEAIAEWLREN